MKAYSPTRIMQILGLTALMLSSTQTIACEYHVAQAQSVWIGIMEKFGDKEEADNARKAFNKAHPHNPIHEAKTSHQSGTIQTKENSSLVEDVQGWMSRVQK